MFFPEINCPCDDGRAEDCLIHNPVPEFEGQCVADEWFVRCPRKSEDDSDRCKKHNEIEQVRLNHEVPNWGRRND